MVEATGFETAPDVSDTTRLPITTRPQHEGEVTDFAKFRNCSAMVSGYKRRCGKQKGLGNLPSPDYYQISVARISAQFLSYSQ